jgi:hypothetical protein
VVDAEDLGCRTGHLADLVLQATAAQEVGREAGEHRGLPLALLGGRSAPPRPRSELADDDGGREVDRESKPVLAVGKRERVPRRQEEPVEREHARDRDGQREAESPEDRDRKHGEDVEHTKAQHRHPAFEQGDHRGDRRHRARARQSRDPVVPQPSSAHRTNATAKVPP